MGSKEALSILSEANGRLGGQPPREREERQNLLDRLAPQFDDLDERFFAMEKAGGLSTQILEYIHANPDAFLFTGVVAVPPHELNQNGKAEAKALVEGLLSAPSE